ncbi:hypothetical protein ACFE04_000732 [Oxalis oulophora]
MKFTPLLFSILERYLSSPIINNREVKFQYMKDLPINSTREFDGRDEFKKKEKKQSRPISAFDRLIISQRRNLTQSLPRLRVAVGKSSPSRPITTYTPSTTKTPSNTYTPSTTNTPSDTNTPSTTYTPSNTYTPHNTYVPSTYRNSNSTTVSKSSDFRIHTRTLSFHVGSIVVSSLLLCFL